MTIRQKVTIIVGIMAIANARYNGKSYKIGDEIPVDYDDVDGLVARGILDKEDAAACKVAAEEEAQKYAAAADEAARLQEEAETAAKAKAEEDANTLQMMQEAHDILLKENAELKATLETVKAEAQEEVGRLNKENDLHVENVSSLHAKVTEADKIIKQLRADKAALEKATKAKK